MRKFILVTALVLVSAQAQAQAQSSVSRGLTMASNDAPVAAEKNKAPDIKASDAKVVDIKASDSKSSDAPKFVERPAAVDEPKADAGKPVVDKKVEKPRYRRESTEARVIYELHRHGIYW